MNVMQMDAAQGEPPALGSAGTHVGSASAAEYQYPVDGLPSTNDISGGGSFPQGRTDNGLLPDGSDSTPMEGMPSLPTDFGGDFQRPTSDGAHSGYDLQLQQQNMYYSPGFDQPVPRQMYAGMTKSIRPPMQAHPPTGYGGNPTGPRFAMMPGSSMASQHGGPTPTLNQLLTQGQHQHQQKYGAGGTTNFMDFGPGGKGPGFDGNQPWGNVHGGMYPPNAYQQQQQQQAMQQQKQMGAGMMPDARRTNGMPPPSYGQIPSQPSYGGPGGPGQMALLPGSPAGGPRRPPVGHPYGQTGQGYTPTMSYGGQQVSPNPQLMYMQQQQQQERGMDDMNMDMQQPGSMHMRSLSSPSGGSSGHPSRGAMTAQSPSAAPGGAGTNSMQAMPRHHGNLGDGGQQQPPQMHSHVHGHMMPPPSMMLGMNPGMNPGMGMAQRMAGSATGSPAAPAGMLAGGFGSAMNAPFGQPSYRPQGQPFPMQQVQPNATGLGYPGQYQLEQQPGGAAAFGGARTGSTAAPPGGHMKSPSHTDVAEKKPRKEVVPAGTGGGGALSHPLTPVAPSPGGNNSVASAGLDEVEDISSPSWPGTPTPRSVSSTGGGSGGGTAAGAGSAGGGGAGCGGGAGSAAPAGSGANTSECLLKVYEMGDEPGRRPFLDRLGALMDETGLPTGAMPQMAKQPLDLYRFYLTVKERGGFEQVSKKKLWKEIGNCIQIGASTYAAFTLKKAYLKYLLNFECKYDRNGLDPQTIISAMEAKAANAKKNSQKKKQAQAAAAAAASSGQGTASMDPSPSGSSTQCSDSQLQYRPQPPSGLDPAAGGHGRFMPGFMMGREQPAAQGDGSAYSQHGHYQQQQQQVPVPMAPHYMPLPDGGGLPGDGNGAALSNGPAYPLPQSSAQPSIGGHPGEFGAAGRARGSNSGGAVHGRPQTVDGVDTGLSQQQQHHDGYAPVSAGAAAPGGPMSDAIGGANGYMHRSAGGVSQEDWQPRLPPHAAAAGGSYYGPQAGFGGKGGSAAGFGMPPHGPAGHGAGGMFRPAGPFAPPSQQPQPYPVPGQSMSSPSMISGQPPTGPMAGPLGPGGYAGASGGAGSFGMNFGHARSGTDGSIAIAAGAGGGGSSDGWPLSPPMPSGGGGGNYTARVSGTSPLQQQQQPWTSSTAGEAASTGAALLPSGGGSSGSSGSTGSTVPSSRPASATASPGVVNTPPSGWERQPQDTSSPGPSVELQQQPLPAAAGPTSSYTLLASADAGTMVAADGSASPSPSNGPTSAPVQPNQQRHPPSPSVDMKPVTPDPSRQPWPTPQPSLTRQQSSAAAGSSPSPRGSSSMPPPGYAPPHLLPQQQQQQRPPQPPSRGFEEAAAVRISAQRVLSGSARAVGADVDFPPGSVEALHWRQARRKVLYSKDIGPVDPWRLMMALKSGLLCESTWALDVLNVLLHDDATVVYFNLLHLPGLLDVILEHYVRALTDVFSEFKCEGLYDDVGAPSSPCMDDVGERLHWQAREPHGAMRTSLAAAKKCCGGSGDADGRSASDAAAADGLRPYARLVAARRTPLAVVLVAPPSASTDLGRPSAAAKTAAVVDDDTDHVLRLPPGVWKAGQHLDHIVDVCRNSDSASFCRRLFYGSLWPGRADACSGGDLVAPKEDRVAVSCASPCCESGRSTPAAIANNGNRTEAAKDRSARLPPVRKRRRRSSQEAGDSGSSSSSEEDAEGSPSPWPRRAQCGGRTASPEPFDGDEPVLAAALDEGREARVARCLCVSNIVRSLSFIPGNEKHMCTSAALLAAIGAVLRLGWVPDRWEQRRHRSHRDRFTEQRDWRWDCLDALREDALVTLSNVSGHLDMSTYDESVCRPLLEAVLFWATSDSAYARDAHSLAACAGTFGAGAAASPSAGLSPRRLAIESMCKMCVHGGNVDLLLATPPWSRLARLFVELVHLLVDARGEPALRELAIVLISGFVQGGEGGAPARALVAAAAAAGSSSCPAAVGAREPCVISLLLDFIEAAEQTAMHVAQSQGVHALRDNPEAMGTSVDMIRRVASVLVTVAQVPDNRPLFARHQGRLLSLVMSQILDQHVSRLLSSVLYECTKSSPAMATPSS